MVFHYLLLEACDSSISLITAFICWKYINMFKNVIIRLLILRREFDSEGWVNHVIHENWYPKNISTFTVYRITVTFVLEIVSIKVEKNYYPLFNINVYQAIWLAFNTVIRYVSFHIYLNNYFACINFHNTNGLNNIFCQSGFLIVTFQITIVIVIVMTFFI